MKLSHAAPTPEQCELSPTPEQCELFGTYVSDLAGLRGTGTFTGITKPDGSTAGDHRGTVYCSK
jgi:hypothetical protein